MKITRIMAGLLALLTFALGTGFSTSYIPPFGTVFKYQAHFLVVVLLNFVFDRIFFESDIVRRSLRYHGLDYASLGLTLTLAVYIFLESKILNQAYFADQVGVAIATYYFWLIAVFSSRWVSSFPFSPSREHRAPMAKAGVLALCFMIDLVLF